MKDIIAYLLFNCYLIAGPKILCQIIAIPIWYDSALFSRSFPIFLMKGSR